MSASVAPWISMLPFATGRGCNWRPWPCWRASLCVQPHRARYHDRPRLRPSIFLGGDGRARRTTAPMSTPIGFPAATSAAPPGALPNAASPLSPATTGVVERPLHLAVIISLPRFIRSSPVALSQHLRATECSKRAPITSCQFVQPLARAEPENRVGRGTSSVSRISVRV